MPGSQGPAAPVPAHQPAAGDLVSALEGVLRLWPLLPVETMRLSAACLRASEKAGADAAMENLLIRPEVRDQWQGLIDWIFHRTCVAGDQWAGGLAGALAQQALLEWLRELRQLFERRVEAKSAAGALGRAAPWPLLVMARSLRCEAEALMLRGARPDADLFRRLDRLLTRAAELGVLETVPEAPRPPSWTSDVLHEVGVLALLYRAFNESLSPVALSRIFLAGRAAGANCICRRLPEDDTPFAVDVGDWGLAVIPRTGGGVSRARMYVGAASFLRDLEAAWSATGGAVAEPGRDDARRLDYLREAWINQRDERHQRRMRTVARVEFVLGMEPAWRASKDAADTGGARVSRIRGSLVDANRSGAALLVDAGADAVAADRFCAVRIDGDANWSGAAVVRVVPSSLGRDGRLFIGLRWLEDFLAPARLFPRPENAGQGKPPAIQGIPALVSRYPRAQDGGSFGAVVPADALAPGTRLALVDLTPQPVRLRVESVVARLGQDQWIRLVPESA